MHAATSAGDSDQSFGKRAKHALREGPLSNLTEFFPAQQSPLHLTGELLKSFYFSLHDSLTIFSTRNISTDEYGFEQLYAALERGPNVVTHLELADILDPTARPRLLDDSLAWLQCIPARLWQHVKVFSLATWPTMLGSSNPLQCSKLLPLLPYFTSLEKLILPVGKESCELRLRLQKIYPHLVVLQQQPDIDHFIACLPKGQLLLNNPQNFVRLRPEDFSKQQAVFCSDLLIAKAGENLSSVKVAIVDSGVNLIEEFRDSSCAIDKGRAFLHSYSCWWRDERGSGSDFASLIAGKTRGIASGVRLYIAKVCDQQAPAEPFAVAEAIRWATAEHVDVISLSIHLTTVCQELNDAIQEALHQCIVIVVSNPLALMLPTSVVHVGDLGSAFNAADSHATPCIAALCSLLIAYDRNLHGWASSDEGRATYVRNCRCMKSVLHALAPSSCCTISNNDDTHGTLQCRLSDIAMLQGLFDKWLHEIRRE